MRSLLAPDAKHIELEEFEVGQPPWQVQRR